MKIPPFASSSIALAILAATLSSGLAAAGALDPAFDPGSGCNGPVTAIVALANGQVLIAGGFTTFSGAPANNVARLNADGSLDTTFSAGSGVVTSVSPVVLYLAVQSDGKIVVAGSFTSLDGYAAPNIIRLDPKGSPDPTFVPPDDTGNISALAVDASDRIYLANDYIFGTYANSGGVARLTANGSIDSTFLYPLTSSDLDLIETIVPRPDGTVFIGGTLSNAPNNAVAQLSAEGQVDPAFAANAAIQNGASTIAVQPDGSVLVAYQTEQDPVSDASEGEIIRLTADGTLDTAFNAGIVPPSPVIGIGVMLVQPDGKIVLGGGTEYSRYAGVNRLNPDGSLDTSFDPGLGASSVVEALALDASGRILVGGEFGSFDNVAHAAIVRLLGASAPTLTVVPGVAVAKESGTAAATFILKLSAAQSEPLLVHYSVQGNAKGGYNYRQLSGQATIAAGKTTATVKVVPINKKITSGAKLTVKLTLEPEGGSAAGSGYVLGNPKTAKISILENH